MFSDREPHFEMGVVPALVEALGDEKVEVLRAAADALGTIGPPEANPAAPVLVNILRERNPQTFPRGGIRDGLDPALRSGP